MSCYLLLHLLGRDQFPINADFRLFALVFPLFDNYSGLFPGNCGGVLSNLPACQLTYVLRFSVCIRKLATDV